MKLEMELSSELATRLKKAIWYTNEGLEIFVMDAIKERVEKVEEFQLAAEMWESEYEKST